MTGYEMVNTIEDILLNPSWKENGVLHDSLKTFIGRAENTIPEDCPILGDVELTKLVNKVILKEETPDCLDAYIYEDIEADDPLAYDMVALARDSREMDSETYEKLCEQFRGLLGKYPKQKDLITTFGPTYEYLKMTKPMVAKVITVESHPLAYAEKMAGDFGYDPDWWKSLKPLTRAKWLTRFGMNGQATENAKLPEKEVTLPGDESAKDFGIEMLADVNKSGADVMSSLANRSTFAFKSPAAAALATVPGAVKDVAAGEDAGTIAANAGKNMASGAVNAGKTVVNTFAPGVLQSGVNNPMKGLNSIVGMANGAIEKAGEKINAMNVLNKAVGAVNKRIGGSEDGIPVDASEDDSQESIVNANKDVQATAPIRTGNDNIAPDGHKTGDKVQSEGNGYHIGDQSAKLLNAWLTSRDFSPVRSNTNVDINKAPNVTIYNNDSKGSKSAADEEYTKAKAENLRAQTKQLNNQENRLETYANGGQPTKAQKLAEKNELKNQKIKARELKMKEKEQQVDLIRRKSESKLEKDEALKDADKNRLVHLENVRDRANGKKAQREKEQQIKDDTTHLGMIGGAKNLAQDVGRTFKNTIVGNDPAKDQRLKDENVKLKGKLYKLKQRQANGEELTLAEQDDITKLSKKIESNKNKANRISKERKKQEKRIANEEKYAKKVSERFGHHEAAKTEDERQADAEHKLNMYKNELKAEETKQKAELESQQNIADQNHQLEEDKNQFNNEQELDKYKDSKSGSNPPDPGNPPDPTDNTKDDTPANEEQKPLVPPVDEEKKSTENPPDSTQNPKPKSSDEDEEEDKKGISPLEAQKYGSDGTSVTDKSAQDTFDYLA